MQVTYIGHATLLIEIGGARFLTDPNFDPKLGRILPRVSAPGIAIDALPRLDAILVTHAHADHLSFDSLDRLPRNIPLYAPPAVARWLRRMGYAAAVEVPVGGEIPVGDVTIHTAAAMHRGHRRRQHVSHDVGDRELLFRR
jgi:L-ascorbate metabolism protein UlaG (beta-lactamase superfamily)